jgi:hypothetical protein
VNVSHEFSLLLSSLLIKSSGSDIEMFSWCGVDFALALLWRIKVGRIKENDCGNWCEKLRAVAL